MAKNEKRQSPPALIDYETEIDAVDNEHLSGSVFLDLWKSKLLRRHRVGGTTYSIKEKTLIKKMVNEFEAHRLEQMMDHWINTNGADKARKLVFFYTERYNIAELLEPKDYSDWD